METLFDAILQQHPREIQRSFKRFDTIEELQNFVETINEYEIYFWKWNAIGAANLLINNALSNEEIGCIEWITIGGNEASNRIAQKLGEKFLENNQLFLTKLCNVGEVIILMKLKFPIILYMGYIEKKIKNTSKGIVKYES